MDLSEFQDIFGTILVGIFTLFVASYLYWVTRSGSEDFGTWLTKCVRTWNDNTAILVTLLLVSFGIGIIAEGLTDYMTDSDSDSLMGSGILAKAVAIPGSLLGDEGAHRLKALTKWDREIQRYKLNDLGVELFRHKDYVVSVLGAIPVLDGNVLPEDSNKVKWIANGLYYPARNWAYLQPNYFQELERDQLRINWARSMFAISFYGLVFALMISLFTFVTRRGKVRFSRFSALLLLICVLTRMAYAQCSMQFNERAYGYFSYHLQHEAWSGEDKDVEAVCRGPVLWARVAAEYHALCIQTFRAAQDEVLRVLASVDRKERTPAVVLDIDETCINNMDFNYFLAQNQLSFAPTLWEWWIDTHQGNPEPVPGAQQFVAAMRGQAVEVFFISNRSESQRQATLGTLVEFGFGTPADLGPANMYLRTDEGSSKEKQRAALTGADSKYVILAWLGDNLADFSAEFEKGSTSAAEQRANVVQNSQNQEKWGTEWFVLPNPVYGDWAAVLNEDDLDRYFQ